MLTARQFDFASATLAGETVHALVQSVSDPYKDDSFLPMIDEDSGQELPPEIITPYEYLVSRNLRFDIVSDKRWDLFLRANGVADKLEQELEPKRLPNGQRTDQDRAKMSEARNDVYKFQVHVQISQFKREDGTMFWADDTGEPFDHAPLRRNRWVGLELGAGPEGGVYVLNITEVPRTEFATLNRKYYADRFSSDESVVAGTIGAAAAKAAVGQDPPESQEQDAGVEQD